MAPEAYEALISFFVLVLIIITINIDPCHVPGLSLGCPEKESRSHQRVPGSSATSGL